MSVLDIASATRSASAFATFSGIEGYDSTLDTDGYSRVIATRDSDGAVYVIYARGDVSDLVHVHNTRSEITHERTQAVARLAELADAFAPADVPADDADVIADRQVIADSDASLAELDKTRAQATLHVARALALFSTVE